MDSGNSESLQSSSGGDDEYGLRAADSSFLSPIFNPLSQSQPSPMFDPLSNYFDPPISSSSSSRPHNPNQLLNLDMGWPKFHSNPSDPNPTNPFFNPQTQTLPFAQLTQNTPPSVTAAAASSSMLNAPAEQAQTQVARNPKKRSRASRRAPTTVLTTDTTNFRAMVQEFTGIPAPPFTSSSPFPRTRLDLFGTPSIRSNPSSTSQPPPYHNLLRPFPQKAQPLLNGTNNITTTTTSTCQLGLLNPPRATSKNPLNNMQIQSPILTFQSFLQSPKYPLHEIASNDSSHLKTGVRVLDEFGLTHGPQLTNSTNHNNAHIISGLPSLVSSDRASPRNENGDGSGYNYSGSSSNFNGSKGLADNVSVSVSTTRGEGLNMESWICSSD